MKMRVETVKDSTGRIRTLRVFKGRRRKGLELDFIYDQFGVLKDLKFEGRREEMPSIPDIVALINEKFMERIAKIGVIGEIEQIRLIGSPLRVRDSLLGASQMGLNGKSPVGHPHINDFYTGMMGITENPEDWVTDIDLTDYWKEDGMRKPKGFTWLNAYSRKVFAYPIVIVNMKKGLGDIIVGTDNHDFFCGLERADGIHSGIATWRVSKIGANPSTVNVAATMGGSAAVEFDVTSYLPADYKTKEYYYGVKVNRNNVQFWYGDFWTGTLRLVAVALLAPNAPTYLEHALPYSIGVAPGYLPTHMPVLAEIVDTDVDVERTMPLAPRWVRATDGDPCPPEVFRLYWTGTDVLVAGYTMEGGTGTTHPFPTFGYSQKLINWMADKAGTLELQVLGMSGNWRTYDSISTTANTLDIYRVQGMPVLMRLKFTPDSYPCVIAEAEALLS